MKHLFARLVALLCVVSCATVAAVAIWPVGRDVRTTDQTGDGRPDVWRHFDASGQVTEVDVDTNFDGQPDIAEFYERGILIRRESDRDFNGQTDLVEEFDAATHAQTRSVVDIDFDGTADLLVLFRDGRPVFSKRTKLSERAPRAAAHHPATNQLAPLTDPFQAETALRAPHAAAGDNICIGLPTSGGLPSPRIELVGRLPRSVRLVAGAVVPRPPALVLPGSPRAPPAI